MKIFLKMLLYIHLLRLFGLGLRPDSPSVDERITGGHNANIIDFPYQVSIQISNWHHCGGAMISEKFVITAAHCGHNPLELYSVFMGASLLSEDGLRIKVKNIVIHPDFHHGDNDVAIFELEEPVIFTDKIQPIQLPSSEEFLSDGTLVTVTGWGQLGEGEDQSNQLQVVQVNIINQEKCREDYKNSPLPDNMICAGVDGGGKDSCAGDSGGPLTANSKLFGIVSWGKGCGEPDYPGIYTYIPKVREFIANITGI